MKTKLIMAFIIIFISSTLVACTAQENTAGRHLNFYNWGNYIDPQIITMFEEETGISVNQEFFGSNQDMFIRVSSGASAYDLVVPSDYMIERMIGEDMLQPINFDNIPNFTNIDNRFKGLPFDPYNTYSVPYKWGTVGILYNTTMVHEEVYSFDILWDEKYKGKIFMYNSKRDTIGVSLKRLGFSLNTTNLEELELATIELINQRPLVQAYIGDPVKDKMIGNEGALAVVYSGDAMFSISENSDLNFVVPTAGSNLWFDSMVIPKGAQNQEEAEMFINFLLRPDIALMNTMYTGFSTPNTEAFKMLPEEMQNDPIYWPSDEIIYNSEVFIDLGDYARYYEEAWIRILLTR
jgi:spermidine/putrescine transport system substrate-binding protein